METVIDPASEAYTIDTREDLDEPVAQIGRLGDYLENLRTEQHIAMREAGAEFEQAIVEHADALSELTEATVTYCREHRDELLEGSGGKSVELRSGKVEYRAGRERMVFTDDSETIIERLLSAGHDDLVRTSHRLSKRELMQAWERIKDIKGLVRERPEDSIKIKPR